MNEYDVTMREGTIPRTWWAELRLLWIMARAIRTAMRRGYTINVHMTPPDEGGAS